MQLSGHKNLKSIENYSTVSTKQQMQMSKVLSGAISGTATKTASDETASSTTCPSTSESQQAMALFSGAVIHGGHFSINIITLNQSPKLALEGSSTDNAEDKQAWKKQRVLEDGDVE